MTLSLCLSWLQTELQC